MQNIFELDVKLDFRYHHPIYQSSVIIIEYRVLQGSSEVIFRTEHSCNTYS